MSVSVDTVYQKVLAICNKEQRGYITPQEFNLLADRAQYEIYQNYFNEIKNAERKPKNQQRFSDIVEQAEEKLQVFKRQQDESFGLTSGSAQIGANTYTSPSKPNWTYVVVNEQALYNASAPDASDFQLHSSEEENLVTKILQLAGVMIKQPDIQQAAINSYQMYNQEKNN